MAKAKKAAAEKTAALRIERMAIEALKPHPSNPRVHPAKDSPKWNLLKKSLEYDYFDPIVFNMRNGMLVSGHLRVRVLADMNYTQVDSVVVDYSEEQHLARMIAANKAIGENDNDRMKELFSGLSDAGFDIELTGFTIPELSDFGFGEEDILQGTQPSPDTRTPHNTVHELAEFGVLVTCQNATEQESAFNALTELGYACKPVQS